MHRKRPRETWTRQDEEERGRLVAEMQEDARLQLQLFTFAVSATAILLGLVPKADTSDLRVPVEFVFLTPLIVLLPISFMILNRARTRNRKAAFILASLDWKRLRIQSLHRNEPLAGISRRRDLPWETALHILARMNSRGRPHLGQDLKYMAFCIVCLELLSIGLSLRASGVHTWWRVATTPWLAVAVFGYAIVLATRARTLDRLRRDRSIQGFAVQWLLDQSHGSGVEVLYLQQFVEKYEPLLPGSWRESRREAWLA